MDPVRYEQSELSNRVDENSGTSANDTSGPVGYERSELSHGAGQGRTGTLNGNPLWAPGKYGAGVNPVRYEKNELSNGVKLDGTGDNVSVSDFAY